MPAPAIAPRLQLLPEPMPNGSHAWRPCPVCGAAWRPFGGTRLPCHAKCLFTEADQDEILHLSENGMTERKLVEELGVTVGVVRSSCAAALKRRLARLCDA